MGVYFFPYECAVVCVQALERGQHVLHVCVFCDDVPP